MKKVTLKDSKGNEINDIMKEKKMCIDCVDYPVCCLSGRCADDEPCEYFQEETDPEEPGNNKD